MLTFITLFHFIRREKRVKFNNLKFFFKGTQMLDDYHRKYELKIIIKNKFNCDLLNFLETIFFLSPFKISNLSTFIRLKTNAIE